jgi:hypothetical protein
LREDTLDVLFTFIKTRMPRDAQESLAGSMYLDILAQILQNNGYRAGPGLPARHSGRLHPCRFQRKLAWDKIIEAECPWPQDE